MKIKNKTKQGYIDAEIGDGIDISSRMEQHRGTVQKGISQTITCNGGNNVGVVVNDESREREQSCNDYDIRKLTPKECIMLMGFESEDYNSLVKCGLKDSNIYHIAGDSIVVNVLISILNNLIEDKLDQHEIVLNDYMKGIVNEKSK